MNIIDGVKTHNVIVEIPGDSASEYESYTNYCGNAILTLVSTEDFITVSPSITASTTSYSLSFAPSLVRHCTIHISTQIKFQS